MSSTATSSTRRIQRASRACEICHSRKVRCDASTLGVPCTNCQAFGFDCKIPSAGRRKKNPQGDSGAESSTQKDESESPMASSIQVADNGTPNGTKRKSSASSASSPELQRPSVLATTPKPGLVSPEAESDQKNRIKNWYSKYVDQDVLRAPTVDDTKVAYIGESSHLSFVVRREESNQPGDQVLYYPLHERFRDSTTVKLSILDADELEALKNRGAFLLPPRDVCDDLIETYFTKIAPQIPVINRTEFIQHYNNVNDPPPLLLLQVIFLAASRVSKNPALVDRETGSTNNASMTFWKRAKALYDADYEDDKVVVVQALLLLSWWWEGPEDVTRNVWYWIGTAIRVAQGIGMHRSVANSRISLVKRRTWKRVWWTCFAQDRRVAVALGRPMCINVEDSDIEMLMEEDFIEEDVPPGTKLKFPPNRNHVLYFIQSVKLTEIMGVVLSRQYSAASRKAQELHQTLDLTHSDMALANWLMSLPPEMQYHCSKGAQKQNFWAAFLHMTYYTVLCLLHRPHLKTSVRTDAGPAAYPSRNIAFTAANMITRILEDVVHYGNLEILPSFSTYAIFSAMIFHSFEIRSPNPLVVEAAHKKLNFCQKSLIDLSRVWLVATSIVTLFEAISKSKTLQDRLTKSATQSNAPAYSTDSKESRKRRAIDAMHESRRLSSVLQYEQKSPEVTIPAAVANDWVKEDAVLGKWKPSNTNTSAAAQSIPRSGFQTPPEFFFSTQQNIPQTFFESYQPNFLFPQDAFNRPSLQQQVNEPLSHVQHDSSSVDEIQISHTHFRSPLAQSDDLQSPVAWTGNNPSGSYQQMNTMSFDVDGIDLDLMQGELLHYPESESSNDGIRGAPAPESLNVAEWYSFLGLHGSAAQDVEQPP